MTFVYEVGASGVDAVGVAVGADRGAVGVVADQADRLQGNRLAAGGGAELGQVHEAVVRGPARAAVFADDVGEGLLLRPSVADEDVVDDPVAGGGDAASLLRHGVSRAGDRGV